MFGVTHIFYQLLALAEFILPVWSLIHVTRTRPDAYIAAGKQTKKFWTILLGVLAFFAIAFQSPLSLPGLAALIAGIVYLVDVKPAIEDVQRPRW